MTFYADGDRLTLYTPNRSTFLTCLLWLASEWPDSHEGPRDDLDQGRG